MTATRDVTVATRVPHDLRADIETLARQRDVDMSTVIRGALRAYCDVHVHGVQPGLADFDVAAAVLERMTGKARRTDPATSKQAARDSTPRAGTQRRAALELIANAGDHGATTDEVIASMEATARRFGGHVAVNSVARRVTDLLQAGAIMDALATRPTRHGAQATVYVATAKGRRWLKETAK